MAAHWRAMLARALRGGLAVAAERANGSGSSLELVRSALHQFPADHRDRLHSYAPSRPATSRQMGSLSRRRGAAGGLQEGLIVAACPADEWRARVDLRRSSM